MSNNRFGIVCIFSGIVKRVQTIYDTKGNHFQPSIIDSVAELLDFFTVLVPVLHFKIYFYGSGPGSRENFFISATNFVQQTFVMRTFIIYTFIL